MIASSNKKPKYRLVLYRHVRFENPFFNVNYHDITARNSYKVKAHRRHQWHD